MDTRTLDRPDATIHLRHRPAADGRWVVFLHGAGMDSHMFDDQIPAIPEGIGICVWDARGHGRSALEGPFDYADMIEDLRALIEGLEAHEVTLVGQSMGGNLAQSYVERYPQDIDGLVLIDCTDNHGPLSRLEKLATASVRPIFTVMPWRWVLTQSARVCGTERSTIEYARRALGNIGKQRFIEVFHTLTTALRPDLRYRVPVPALLLCGDADASGNIRTAMPRLAARNPDADLVIIDGAGHISNMDRPEATNHHLRAFLERIR